MIAPEIKNIIFDLGGVIINLSVETTVLKFSALTGIPIEVLQQKVLKSDLFKEYEAGMISDQCFRDQLRTSLNVDCTDAEIDECWNAMLLDIPKDRLQLLLHLRKKYRVFLLSNTNEIHFIHFTKKLHEAHAHSSFDDFFEKTYYSHRLGMRKPQPGIFELVVNENNLLPAETLFLDDLQENLQGAASVGIATFHVQHPQLLFPLFDYTP